LDEGYPQIEFNTYLHTRKCKLNSIKDNYKVSRSKKKENNRNLLKQSTQESGGGKKE
jgi:hypothetical protein